MERDYKPDGWLGILIGTKLFFDFSGKYEFREKFSKLIVELQRLKTALYGETIDGIAPLHVEPTHVSYIFIKNSVNFFSFFLCRFFVVNQFETLTVRKYPRFMIDTNNDCLFLSNMTATQDNTYEPRNVISNNVAF